MQMSMFLAVAYLTTAGLWTASDPFVGKWRLDGARSVILDQFDVETAGPNRYTFRFEGAPAETIVADGTDQPGVMGTTLAVRFVGARGLKVVRKKDGATIVDANWTLAEDGRTLRDDFTGVNGDGSNYTIHYLYRRRSGTSGFAGSWESRTPPAGLAFELRIQPSGPEAFSFGAKTVTFDGRDHPSVGAAEATAAGRRVSARAMEVVDKVGGKIADTKAYRLSGDGKTLTMTVRKAGQATSDRYVFQRE